MFSMQTTYYCLLVASKNWQIMLRHYILVRSLYLLLFFFVSLDSVFGAQYNNMTLFSNVYYESYYYLFYHTDAHPFAEKLPPTIIVDHSNKQHYRVHR